MDKDSEKVILLCGVFNDSYKSLTRAAFWKLYHQNNDSVDEVFNSGDKTVEELKKRSGSLAFALEKLYERGFRIVTFLDDEYPKRLKAKLGDMCPPILYTCGNSELRNKKTVGYVGARNIEDCDVKFTQERVKENIADGFGIVTGGAKGIDDIALKSALSNDGFAILFLPDNISIKVREPIIHQNILDGKLLVYSHVSPFATKSRNSFVAAAMERNKYIYAMSNATVVVHADYNKGGTWAGATEALKHKWGYVYTWDNKKYIGNQKLIERNAVPLSDDGQRISNEKDDCNSDQELSGKQLSLFDYFNNDRKVMQG